jgi:hypothetical protein
MVPHSQVWRFQQVVESQFIELSASPPTQGMEPTDKSVTPFIFLQRPRHFRLQLMPDVVTNLVSSGNRALPIPIT